MINQIVLAILTLSVFYFMVVYGVAGIIFSILEVNAIPYILNMQVFAGIILCAVATIVVVMKWMN